MKPHGTALDGATRQRAHFVAGAEHTSDSAVSRPVSAALSRPYSVKVSGWQGRTTARRAAWRNPCVQPLPAHPLPLNTLAGGPQKLIPEPETMTPQRAGKPGPVAPERDTIPHAFRARLALRLASRAEVRRAELRALAFELVAADRLNRGGAA